jgi:hypothetical protein
MGIDIFHNHAQQRVTRKTLRVFGLQSDIAHNVIEQVGSIGTKPIGDTTRALGRLTEGNVFLFTLLLKVWFISIRTDQRHTKTLLNEPPGNTTP